MITVAKKSGDNVYEPYNQHSNANPCGAGSVLLFCAGFAQDARLQLNNLDKLSDKAHRT